MIETFLFMFHNLFLLIFGTVLSAAFSGIFFTRKNIIIVSGHSVCTGLLQLIIYASFGEDIVRKFYPLVTHLPLLILLICFYRKKFHVAVTSLCTAYLCCHPAKWFGILAFTLTESFLIEYTLRIAVLFAIGTIVLIFFAPYFSKTFHNSNRGTYILGFIPIIYYLFDYLFVVYTDLWTANNKIVLEFLPFFLCIVFMFFCTLYCKEYEQKSEAERKEQIIRITLEQQEKEIHAVKRKEEEIRILHHDIRLLLNKLSLCIENDDAATARKIIDSYINVVESTTIHKYCTYPIINYILSDFVQKCDQNSVDFRCQINLSELNCDESIFSTIMSNALDNALNAQKRLPENKRSIHVMLKNRDHKLLFSVKNPFFEQPIFIDGFPASNRKGHGYGTKSIAYLTERLGGNYQFTLEDDLFVLRVVIAGKQFS